MNIPNVPCLIDCSSISSVLPELDCAIVVHSVYSVRTLKSWLSVLPVLILLNHHRVTYLVGMRSSSRVLSLIILANQALPAFFDELPVSFESYIINRIVIKHQLHWCCTRGGMNCGTHRESHGTKNARPVSTGQVILACDFLYGNHAVNGLVSSLYHRICLWVTGSN